MASETIIGSYRVEERIGRGGMGVVYRGRHTKLPREVAIKSINPRVGGRDLRHMRHRFEREAYIQSQLDHPAIVKIYDYVVAEQTYYIVMEYVEGRSLAQLLKQEPSPLPVERALSLFEQILAAVAYAHTFVYQDQDGRTHRGIIHRDLKPANIMVTPQDRIKITDFGIVKFVGAETTDTFGGAYGSPRYVSPEQAEGAPLDQRSDIYSLGVILYEMLTGVTPFGGDDAPLARTEILRAHSKLPPRPPTSLNPGLPPEVEAVILRALEKEPARRFQTAQEFLRAVRPARAKDAGKLVGEGQAVAADQSMRAYRKVGTHELEAGFEDTVRQGYVTQPMQEATCGACGADAAGEETACRVCGAELGASPATGRILERESKARPESRGKWLVAGLISLMLLTGAVILVRFTRRPLRQPAAQTGAPAPPAATADAPAGSPGVPAALAEISPAGVAVDSSYDGYSAKPLTDGVVDVRQIAAMRYNDGNWVSAETPLPHWIEFRLREPARVSAVYVYWGFDRNRFMPSRRAELQTPDGNGGWRTISKVEPGADYDRTAFEFAPVTAARLRLLQPEQQGPQNRPFLMWVREVKVFGSAENSQAK